MKNLANIRRKNLAALVEEHGLTSVASKIKRSASQINDTLAGRKSFGEKVARAIEAEWDSSRPAGWLDTSHEKEDLREIVVAQPATPKDDYIRLEHLPYQPSMGKGLVHDGETIVQHLDVLKSFVKQKIGSSNPSRVKILTGVGQSMTPVIQDQDIVFVDIEHRWIDAPGYYVIDVGGLLLLKKAMIQASGKLILSSENIADFPDSEEYDLKKAEEIITVCGKVLAWWSLRRG